MDFSFTEEQNMLRRSVRGELERLGADAAAAERLWPLAVAQGWAALMHPPDLGGLGLGLVEGVILHEELGRALRSGPFAASSALPAGLKRLGCAVVPDALWEAAATGEARLTVGEAQGEHVALTFADTASHVVIVDLSSPGEAGFAVCPVAALVGLETREGLDVGVPYALAPAPALPMARLDRPAADAALGGVRLLNCAEIVGLADEALAITLAYVKERKQFDKPVGSFQAVKHALANAFVALENGKTALYHAAWMWDRDAGAAVGAVDAARARIGRMGIDILHACIQAHGGIAFTWEYGLHERLRRIRRLSATLGTVAEAKRAVARALLDA